MILTNLHGLQCAFVEFRLHPIFYSFWGLKTSEHANNLHFPDSSLCCLRHCGNSVYIIENIQREQRYLYCQHLLLQNLDVVVPFQEIHNGFLMLSMVFSCLPTFAQKLVSMNQSIGMRKPLRISRKAWSFRCCNTGISKM